MTTEAQVSEEVQTKPQEGQGQEVEQQPELTQEQVEAQFAEGFDGKPAEKLAGLSAEAKTEAKAEEVVAEAKADDKVEDEQPIAGVGLTPTQLRAALAMASEVPALKDELAKTRDGLHGKFGEVFRKLQTMQAGGKISKEALKRVTEVFGEELAEALASDLSGAFMPMDVDKFRSDLEEESKKRLEESRRDVVMEVERRLLVKQHPDFYEQKDSPEFKLWQQSNMSPEDQETWKSSIDSDFFAKHMTAFKEWRSALSKKQDKRKVLEAAVQPKGAAVVQGGISDEAAFEQGFYGRA